MTSAWGSSWGSAWGNSWGTISATVDDTSTSGNAGSGYVFVPAYQKYRIEELARLANELKAAELAKDSLEQRRLEEISKTNKKLAKKQEIEISRLEALAQEEISRILELRSELLRRITDEEEALILLYSLPFVH